MRDADGQENTVRAVFGQMKSGGEKSAGLVFF
jgi:hypothetical protein